KGDPTARDQLTIAQIWVFQGNPERADSTYRAIIGRDSTSSDARFAMMEMAKLKFRGKDYPATVEALQRLIALDPNSDEAYYYSGLSYKEMKRYPEALDAFRQAATLADGKSDRQFWLGVLYAQLDSVPQAWMRLGQGQQNSGNRPSAVQSYKKALELDASQPDALRGMKSLGAGGGAP